MVVSSTSMKLASATRIAITHGLAAAPLTAAGAPARVAAALIATPSAARRARVWARPARSGPPTYPGQVRRRSADRAIRIGVDPQRHRLPGPHAVELNLLEVRRDPDLIRHEHCQVRSRLRKLADGGAEVDDSPRLGRSHCRIGKIELREACDRAVALRLQRLDLPLRQLQRRLRARERGLLLP